MLVINKTKNSWDFFTIKRKGDFSQKRKLVGKLKVE